MCVTLVSRVTVVCHTRVRRVSVMVVCNTGVYNSCVTVMLTWRDLADGGRMPAVALVAVWTLDKDGAVTEALCKHLPPNVV